MCAPARSARSGGRAPDGVSNPDVAVVVKAAKSLGSILGDGTSWCLLHDSGRRERINVFAGGVSRGMELRA